MKPKTNGNIQRTRSLNHAQGDGTNWVLIAGGALLSTLSIRIGWRLKQAFDAKRSNNIHHTMKGLENEKCAAKGRPGTCKVHSNIYCYMQEEDGCYHCVSENLHNPAPTSPILKDGDPALPLVMIPTPGSNKDANGVMWASSPDRLELSRKPFHRSNSSNSPSFSESGSDIYSKREVIQKLRQQLKRRDEMIMEMQNSLSAQMARSARLQAQLDAANRDLFDSEIEIQRLRKALADHCVVETMNGEANGYADGGIDDAELRCVGVGKGRGDFDKIQMLKREVGELREVIGGKEFLLRGYKEQKVELSAKVKELEQKLASQVLNIL